MNFQSPYPRNRRILQNDQCALCGSGEKLQLSHVISGLLLRHRPWAEPELVKPKVFLQFYDEKGKSSHMMDGDKYHMLCKKCEALCCKSEDKFGQLYPFSPEGSSVQVGPWFYTFCLAQIWRSLVARWHNVRPEEFVGPEQKPECYPGGRFETINFRHSTEEQDYKDVVEAAERAWRGRLLEQLTISDKFKIYAVPLHAKPDIKFWDNDGYHVTLYHSPNLQTIAVHVLIYELLFVGVIKDADEKLEALLANFEIRPETVQFKYISDLRSLKRNHPYLNWFRTSYKERAVREAKSVLVVSA